jgi:hypothetical protein
MCPPDMIDLGKTIDSKGPCTSSYPTILIGFVPYYARRYIAIQITEITTSRPLVSPPSYLKLHIPSVFSFQYAPVAECMPLLPTWGLPSVDVASAFESLVEISASPFSEGGREDSWAALALLRADVGTRCWMMVLFTAYLYDGVPPAGDDSEISDRRMEF